MDGNDDDVGGGADGGGDVVVAGAATTDDEAGGCGDAMVSKTATADGGSSESTANRSAVLWMSSAAAGRAWCSIVGGSGAVGDAARGCECGCAESLSLSVRTSWAVPCKRVRDAIRFTEV